MQNTHQITSKTSSLLLIVPSGYFHLYILNKNGERKRRFVTWYHMQIAVTGIKMTKTCQATCDMTAMVPIICIIEKAHHPNLWAISKSSTLWSVDAWKYINKYLENLSSFNFILSIVLYKTYILGAIMIHPWNFIFVREFGFSITNFLLLL